MFRSQLGDVFPHMAKFKCARDKPALEAAIASEAKQSWGRTKDGNYD